MAQAFRKLHSGRPRPVALEVPPDVLGAKAEVTLAAPLAPEPPAALDEDAIAQAAQMLAAADCPVIFVGGGAHDAAAEVQALAERLTAPVVGFRRGKGVLDNRHVLSHSLPGGHALWAKADVVLAVGTRMFLPLSAWGTDDKLKIIRIDIDPGRVRAACACRRRESPATPPRSCAGSISISPGACRWTRRASRRAARSRSRSRRISRSSASSSAISRRSATCCPTTAC